MKPVLIALALAVLVAAAGCGAAQKSSNGPREVQLAVTDRGFEPARTEIPRGQALTLAVDRFPVPVTAAIRGYCMGGSMDLALACDYRIAAPNAVFGHRGASLGVVTGWGGTQRLPRLIGKARALQMFLLAEMVPADEALRIGLVDAIAEDPLAEALRMSHLPAISH